MKIIPTVGRKVWLYNVDGGINTQAESRVDYGSQPRHGYADQSAIQPVDATIVAVHSDDCVNIAGNDAQGHPFSRTSVKLWDGEGDPPTWMHARWMPYQIGQAKANAS